MSQVPALFKSKTSASDQISLKLIKPKICYMFEHDFENGSGPIFESEKIAKECAGENMKVIKISVNRA